MAAAARGDTATAMRSLSADAVVTYGDDTATDVADLSRQLRGAAPAKMLAAGSTVAVSITAERQRGVLFADFERGNLISRVRYFDRA